MLILIDGYNLIGPVAPPGRSRLGDQPTRWLEHARLRLINEVATGLGPSLAEQTWIIFDSKRLPSRVTSSADEPVERSVIQGVTIEFSIGYDEADDRIEELIAGHHTPKRLTVVSSDHRLQVAARRRGALAVDSDVWLDRLSDGRPLLAIPVPERDHDTVRASDSETTEIDPTIDLHMDTTSWLRYFEVEDETVNRAKTETEAPKIVDNPFPPGYGEDLLDD